MFLHKLKKKNAANQYNGKIRRTAIFQKKKKKKEVFVYGKNKCLRLYIELLLPTEKQRIKPILTWDVPKP